MDNITLAIKDPTNSDSYGAFKDLKLMEVYKENEANITIFRYKALYTRLWPIKNFVFI
jgi:hypothetical protein